MIMTDKRRFILSEIGIYLVTHIIDLSYMFTIVYIAPDMKKHRTQSDYTTGWILLVVFTCIYLYVLIKYLHYQKTIGLGGIYSIITEILYVIMNISMLLEPPFSDTWGGLNIFILLFSFTGLPVLFIIIAIVYFAVKHKKAKNKSGE